jgi:hypothetical protein
VGGRAYLGDLLQHLNANRTSACHNFWVVVSIDVLDAGKVGVGHGVVLREGGIEEGGEGGREGREGGREGSKMSG